MHSSNAFIQNDFCGILSVFAFMGKKTHDHASTSTVLSPSSAPNIFVCFPPWHLLYTFGSCFLSNWLTLQTFYLLMHSLGTEPGQWTWHCSWYSLLFELQEHYKDIMQIYHYKSPPPIQVRRSITVVLLL